MRTRAFWALFSAYMFTPLAVFPVVTHQVAFAVDQGFPRLFVASIFGLTGLMSVGGRVLFGVAADRIGRAPSATLSYTCTALGTLALLSLERWHDPAPLYVYALLFGLGFGARGPIITAMAAQLFPGRRFAAIYGAITVGNGAGGAVGPWFAGAIHDMTGSYRIAFLLSRLLLRHGRRLLLARLLRPPPETARRLSRSSARNTGVRPRATSGSGTRATPARGRGAVGRGQGARGLPLLPATEIGRPDGAQSQRGSGRVRRGPAPPAPSPPPRPSAMPARPLRAGHAGV